MTTRSFSQILPLGPVQDPPGIHWRSIETPHFEIIFPDSIENDAQRTANTLEYLYPKESASLLEAPRKISVILRNQSVESNAFVTLAPRRSEWFNTPAQINFTGTTDWYQLLATHEFRHVVQFDKTNHYFEKLYYYLFGESGALTMSFISVPFWFWEGDAVGMETALTQSGRGRLPSFTMPIRTMVLSGQNEKYYQLMYGSYKNSFGNYYPLGYLMTTYVKREGGGRKWSDILNRNSYFPFLYTFSWAMSAKTGKGASSTYDAMIRQMNSVWSEQLKEKQLTAAQAVYINSNGFMTRSEANPQTAGDGSVIFYEGNLGEVSGIKKLKTDGQIETIARPFFVDYFSVGGDKAVWIEREFDLRWQLRDGGVIRIADLNSGAVKTLTSRTRFTFAALSPDAKRIAAVEFSRSNKCAIVILDASSGKEIERIPNPENYHLVTPSWSEDGGRLVMIRQDRFKGRAISVFDFSSGQFTDAVPFGLTMTFHKPVFWGKRILFNAYYGGIDNIFAVDAAGGGIFQVTSRKFGAFNASIARDGKTLLFDDYQKDGYTIASMPLVPDQWTKVDPNLPNDDGYYKPLIAQENGPVDFEAAPKITFPAKDYNHATNAVNIHTWFINFTEQQRGFGLISLNKLGTLQTSIDYAYDIKEKTHGVEATASYAGRYPIFDVTTRYGGRASTYTDSSNNLAWYTWNEKTLILAGRVPLNLSRNGWVASADLGVSAGVTRISDKNVGFYYEQNNGLFRPVVYSLNFFRGYGSNAYIYPVWGQQTNFIFEHSPLKDDYEGRHLSAKTDLFFPGLMKRQSIYLQGWYESQKKNSSYRFPTLMTAARGYPYRYHDKVYKLSSNYAVPLLYPDANLAGLMYVRRIYTNPFFDYSKAEDSGSKKTSYRSAGNELIANMYFFTLPLEVGFGIRYSYLLDRKNAEKQKRDNIEMVLFLTGNF